MSTIDPIDAETRVREALRALPSIIDLANAFDANYEAFLDHLRERSGCDVPVETFRKVAMRMLGTSYGSLRARYRIAGEDYSAYAREMQRQSQDSPPMPDKRDTT